MGRCSSAYSEAAPPPISGRPSTRRRAAPPRSAAADGEVGNGGWGARRLPRRLITLVFSRISEAKHQRDAKVDATLGDFRHARLQIYSSFVGAVGQSPTTIGERVDRRHRIAVVRSLYEDIGTWGEVSGPDGLSIPIGGNPVEVPSLCRLWEFQAGYRWHGFTQERLADWHEEWLVIASEGGNPFILDMNSNRVLFDLVGRGRWEPAEFASDLPTALGALGVIACALDELGDDARNETCEIREEARECVQAKLASFLESAASAQDMLQACGW